ncbi:FAD:protein FMN transferase [Endothiovibrio diazotrophicus]
MVAGCSRPPEPYQERIYIFGTLVDLTIWGAPEEKAREAAATLARSFEKEHHEWHAWKPGALTDLNAAIARGEPHAVPDTLVPLLVQSKALYRASGGLFDPAIGGLIGLWGFHQDEPPHGEPPPPNEAIERWRAANPTMDDLTIDGNVVTSHNRAVQLDLGGFAKGYAVDRAIEALKSMGIGNAIVNAGGDLRAIGSKDGRPWRVGVRHPQGKGVLAAIEVTGDESVFTSGNYERYNEYKGVRYAHILDPRTGMPVQGITSVTVIHDNGAEADAAATALVVAGVDKWWETARSMGIRYAMVVEENGTVHLNPAMRDRVTFTGETPPLDVSKPLF